MGTAVSYSIAKDLQRKKNGEGKWISSFPLSYAERTAARNALGDMDLKAELNTADMPPVQSQSTTGHKTVQTDMRFCYHECLIHKRSDVPMTVTNTAQLNPKRILHRPNDQTDGMEKKKQKNRGPSTHGAGDVSGRKSITPRMNQAMDTMDTEDGEENSTTLPSEQYSIPSPTKQRAKNSGPGTISKNQAEPKNLAVVSRSNTGDTLDQYEREQQVPWRRRGITENIKMRDQQKMEKERVADQQRMVAWLVQCEASYLREAKEWLQSRDIQRKHESSLGQTTRRNNVIDLEDFFAPRIDLEPSSLESRTGRTSKHVSFKNSQATRRGAHSMASAYESFHPDPGIGQDNATWELDSENASDMDPDVQQSRRLRETHPRKTQANPIVVYRKDGKLFASNGREIVIAIKPSSGESTGSELVWNAGPRNISSHRRSDYPRGKDSSQGQGPLWADEGIPQYSPLQEINNQDPVEAYYIDTSNNLKTVTGRDGRQSPNRTYQEPSVQSVDNEEW